MGRFYITVLDIFTSEQIDKGLCNLDVAFTRTADP